MNKFTNLLLALFCTIAFTDSHCQISNGGIPYTFQNNIPKSIVDVQEIAKPHSSIINSAPWIVALTLFPVGEILLLIK